jgi:AraC family transcriptional regulator of arabinose operon
LHGTYRIGADPETSFEAKAGDLVLLRPDTMHIWTNSSDPGDGHLDVLFALFRPPPRLLPLLEHPEIMPGYSRLRLDSPLVLRRVRRCLLEMNRIFNSSLPLRIELQFNLLEQALMWCALEHRQQQATLDPRLQRAIDYMASHLSEPIQLSEIARWARLSRSQVSMLFDRQLTASPMRYLEKLRIDRAKELLCMSSEKLDVIAQMVGFCDAKYLSNRFRKAVGMAPNEYRRSRQAPES